MITQLLKSANKKLQPKNYFFGPEWIVLGVNNVCNLHCKMCDVGTKTLETNFAQNLVGTHPLNMPLDLIKNIIDQIALYYPKAKLGYAFTEPLVYPHLEASLKYANEKNIKTTITTNALTLKQNAKKLVDANLEELYISLDGPEEIHNEIRGHKNLFKKQLKELKRFFKFNPKQSVSIFCVITEWNIGFFNEFVAFFKDFPLKEIGFMHTNFTPQSVADKHNMIWGNKYKATASNVEEINIDNYNLDLLWEEINEIKQNKSSFPISFSPEIENKEKLNEFYLKPDKIVGKRCNDIFSNIMIKSDGSVIPSHGRCYNLNLGNIYNNSLKEIWNAQILKEFRSDLIKTMDYFLLVADVVVLLNYEKQKNNTIQPKSANGKHRIPNSILQVGASIHGKFEYVFVDGNLEENPWQTIENYLKTGEFKYFGSTVMPYGPQLRQAIPFTKKIKEKFPEITTIWGGYFASNQYKVCLNSGYVDYVINGPGDNTFPELLNNLESNTLENLSSIKNLIFKNEKNEIVKTASEALLDQDALPKFPYEYLNSFYPVKNYLAKTFMGNKTLSYHSSMGCPFSCSFCAVVPIYNAKWKGMSANRIYEDVKYFKSNYNIDAVEFHDNNFFTSKKRVLEFSELIINDNISYWGEGRIDTINMYSDDDLKLMRKAGCKMIFLGAETGNDAVLKQMNKGGTQTGQMIKDFVLRMKNADIIPELSFVLGMPAPTEKEVYNQILWDINFIKEIKQINPNAEIIIYLFSPVPTEGSELYQQILDAGFSFPTQLEDWILPSWENFDLRKNPLTPWLKPYMIDTIKNFETVLNGYYPTVSDFRIKGYKKSILKSVAGIRYKTGFYKFPYEIKALHKIWKYRQPEIEGFYSE